MATWRKEYERDPVPIEKGGTKMRKLLWGLSLAMLGLFGLATTEAATLDDVKQRGKLICGIAPNIAGFAFTDNKGVVRGFDIEFCRALAPALLGVPHKTELKPFRPRDAFPKLKNGAVDIITSR